MTHRVLLQHDCIYGFDDAMTHLEVRSRDACASIAEANANICVWNRRGAVVIFDTCEVTPVDIRVDARSKTRARRQLGDAFGALPSTLAADILDLCDLYFSLTDCATVHVQLAFVHTDKCRRFHVDNLGLRLLCTYSGPGTEWLPDAYAHRQAVYDCECPAHARNDALVKDPRQIKKVRTGDVVIMKGERFPGNAGAGIIHRSPPIQSSGISRLVLTIDDLASA
jgi:Protein of unknown function (DUF1826)